MAIHRSIQAAIDQPNKQFWFLHFPCGDGEKKNNLFIWKTIYFFLHIKNSMLTCFPFVSCDYKVGNDVENSKQEKTDLENKTVFIRSWGNAWIIISSKSSLNNLKFTSDQHERILCKFHYCYALHLINRKLNPLKQLD